MPTYQHKRRLVIFISLISLFVLSFFSVLAERPTKEITIDARVADYSRDGKVVINYQASPENKYIATNCLEAEGLSRVRGTKGSFVIDVKDYQPGTHTITLYSVAAKGPDYQEEEWYGTKEVTFTIPEKEEKKELAEKKEGETEKGKKKEEEEIVEHKNRIRETYGVEVKDSRSKWGTQGLRQLEETLKNIPKIFHGKASLELIKRSDAYREGGRVETSVFGMYESDKKSVTIFNQAYNPYDFKTPEKQFVGTIVHELTHSVQFYDKSSNEVCANPYENPLVEDYAKIAGWKKDKATGNYIFRGDKSKLPTEYGGTDVLEDMAEAAMIYYCEPDKLKNTSIERYNHLKEKIFDGKEYK